jgi:hypothetical protein
MKYNGVNKEGFERDARLFNEARQFDGLTDEQVAEYAEELARDYGIDCMTIWDILPEYEAQA